MIRSTLCFLVASLIPCSSFVQAQTWLERPCSTYGANCRDIVPDQHQGVPGTISSTITISAADGAAIAPELIGAVRAHVRLIHTRLEDVTLTLTDPNGVVMSLPTIYSGTRQDIDALYNGLDDSYLTTYGDTIPALNGPVQQLALVSWHGGSSVAGNWTLTVTDSAHLDYGALDGWSLDFWTSQPFVWVTATGPNATESPLTTGEFTVTRAIVTTSPLTVYLTFGGTASSGLDYEPIVAPVTIPAYQASATITVTPIPRTGFQRIRTIVATVTPRPGYVAGDSGGGSTSAVVDLADGPKEIPFLGPWQLLLLTALLAGAGIMAVNRRRRDMFGPGGQSF